MGQQKTLEPVAIALPPKDQRRQRDAAFTGEGEKKSRYSLPNGLESSSPVGYRTRLPMNEEELREVLPLLSLERPTGFAATRPISEQELFEENSLGILVSRQSTNYRGHQQTTLGPETSAQVQQLLSQCKGLEAEALTGASYTHLVFSKPYRTPFTLLLTFVGHKPITNLWTVAKRAWNKRFHYVDDIPTIGYLQDLHLGILADGMERAAVIASEGRRRAQVFSNPFLGRFRKENKTLIETLEKLGGLSAKEKSQGWRLSLVTQVGEALEDERVQIRKETCRKLGANLMAFRSERIQPGVNMEAKAPDAYHHRQDMDFSVEFTDMAGRAAFNAFAHWAGCDRERAKELLLLDRIDVLSEGGKERLRELRKMLGDITDKVIEDLPLWADLPTGKAFSRSANQGRKAFALAGQRIYIGGLSRQEIDKEQIEWKQAIRAVGACAARSGLYAELMGCYNLPEDCDLLAGLCLMAGPVNQNDIGKQFYNIPDLLDRNHSHLDPTSMLVWTLKAKTVADPIGNEEQLMNAKRKGMLVDLRCGPHEVCQLEQGGTLVHFRQQEGQTSKERAFGELGNFVKDGSGQTIPGNEGKAWPQEWSGRTLFGG